MFSMNISKALIFPLLILQLHHAWTLNVALKGWRLHAFKPNKSIDESIKEYFSKRTRLLSVALHLEYLQHWQILINEYLTDVLKKSESMSFRIHVKDSRSTRNKEIFPHNLWYVDSYEAFRSLLPDFQTYSGNQIGKYMVVMQTAKRLQPVTEVKQIFQHAFQLNMVNIVVAVYASQLMFYLYSYDVFRPGHCRQALPRLVNRFLDGKFDSPELFPHKFGNFHKCPVTLFVRYADPYFTFNLTKDGQYIDRYKGMEAHLVDAMAEHLNFDRRFFYKDLNYYGTVYQNGTSTGPFQLLKEGHIDILLGYNHYLAPSRYFSGTEAYFITPLVLIYQDHKQSVIGNIWLWEPFQNHVWIFILSIVGFGMVFTSWLRYSCSRHNGFPIPMTWLDMLGVVLGNARPLKFQYYTTKYACMTWVYGFMIFCAIYQGKLYDALNRKATPKTASLQKLFDSNYTFLFREVLDKDVVASLNVPQHSIHYLPYADDVNIYDEMLQYPGNVATVTNYWQYQAYINKNRLYSEFNAVPTIVVMHQICAYMRRQSYLNPPISHLLSNLNSGGIIKKWMNDEAIFDSYTTLKKMKEDKSHTEPRPLTFDQVRLVFKALSVMYLLSLLVFLGENVANQISIKRN